MKYKIGKVEGELPHKFIVAREPESGEPESLVYYARSWFDPEFDGNTKHANIADKYLVKPVGGGMVSGKGTTISLYDRSRDYGGVPTRILKRFEAKLLEEYRKTLPDTREIVIKIEDERIDGQYWDQFDKDEA